MRLPQTYKYLSSRPTIYVCDPCYVSAGSDWYSRDKSGAPHCTTEQCGVLRLETINGELAMACREVANICEYLARNLLGQTMGAKSQYSVYLTNTSQYQNGRCHEVGSVSSPLALGPLTSHFNFSNCISSNDRIC